MKHSSLGMSIIETSIALTISSFLILALYQSFNTAQKNSQSISATMKAEHAFAIAYNQLDKDISALFVPEIFFAQRIQKESSEKSADVKTSDYTKATGDKEKNKESFKNIFKPLLKEKNLESVTFVSTHSLPLYNSKSPNAVRIVYRLIKQENSELYSLYRQESPQLVMSLAQFTEKNIPSYELMRNIKSLTMSFTVRDKEKKDEKEEFKKYSTLSVWPEPTNEKELDYIIPAYITLTGVFVDATTEREYDFEWIFPVPIYDDVMHRLIHSEKKEAPRIEQKNENEKKQESQNKKEQSPKNPDNKKSDNKIFGINLTGNKK